MTAEVIHQYDSRDGQQVQEVGTDTQTHEIGNENQPLIRTFFIGMLVPFQYEPEHHSGKQGRQGIYLTLNGREPEGIREGVCQRAYKTRT